MKFQDYIKNKRSNIVLTDSQEKAMRTVNDFLSDPFGPQCLIIKGGAGSGKTFIGSLIKEFLPNNTHIFTPTGRAANGNSWSMTQTPYSTYGIDSSGNSFSSLNSLYGW